LIEVELR